MPVEQEKKIPKEHEVVPRFCGYCGTHKTMNWQNFARHLTLCEKQRASELAA